MAKTNALLASFNRGEVGKLALARIDIDRLRLSAEEQVNWLPRVLGPMSLRPGLQYVGSTLNNQPAVDIPFVFSSFDTAILEMTANVFRPLVEEAPIIRTTVSTYVDNGDFSTTGGWSSQIIGGESSVTIDTVSKHLILANSGLGSISIAKQTIAVDPSDLNKQHGIRVIIDRGPVTMRIGTTDGDDDVMTETSIGTGEHSLEFYTTVSPIYLQFESRAVAIRLIHQVRIESNEEIRITTPYSTSDLGMIRYDQSGDIVYLACYGFQQRRIERRGARAWSIVLEQPSDGPFAAFPPKSVSLNVDNVIGNTNLHADRPLFKDGHVGALLRLFTTGFKLSVDVANSDTYTPAVRVSGVGADRKIYYNISGTWTGQLTLQRSFTSEDAGFVDVQTFTSNASSNLLDALDNSIVWYRIGFKPATWSSGAAVIGLDYAGGGDAGIMRIISVSGQTTAQVEIITNVTSTDPSSDWRLGEWSDQAGWPTAVAFHDGRLFWSGRDKIWGSISDAYDSYDITYTGDAGPISRSLGSGPIEIINFLLPLTRLIVGTDASERSIRSSAFDEPLTPSNFNIKDCSTQGTARLPALKMDTKGLFVSKTGRKLFEIAYDVNAQDYQSHDLNQLHPNLNTTDIVHVAIQRQPDTRIHLIRSDGTAAVLTHETDEQVEAWWRVETDGVIERAVVLPGGEEDFVYYIVRRTVGGVSVRYRERFAMLSECNGGSINKQADSCAIYQGSPTTNIPAAHLEGREVIVWADGKDLGTTTVYGGLAPVTEAVSNAVVGLGYSARFKSAKLAYAAALGTA